MAITALRLPTDESQQNVGVGLGDGAWTDIVEVEADDAVPAQFEHGAGTTAPGSLSKYLFAKSFGFTTLGLPATDVVRGIELSVVGKGVDVAADIEFRTNSIKVFLGGVPVGPELKTTALWSIAGYETKVYGDINEDFVWGVQKPRISTLTESGFGYAISVSTFPDPKSIELPEGHFDLDAMWMRIRHEPPREPLRTGMIHI